MSAIDDWKRLPYPARRALLDALAKSSVVDATLEEMAAVGERLNDYDRGKVSREQRRDLAIALSVLEEANV